MGLLHIYCGDGKGKTTAATGLAVRASGSGRRVLFVQMMKDGCSSEAKALKLLPGVCYMCCERHHGFFKSMTDEQKSDSSALHRALFDEAAARADDFDLIVFDELVSAYRCGLLDRKKVLSLLGDKEKRAEIVLTGRDPAPELTELADYISCIQKLRHPFDRGVPAREGIEF